MSPPACQEPRLDPESVTSGLGRGARALWLAWTAGTLALIPTACVYAIICARMMLGIGSFIRVRRLQQALKKGASSGGTWEKLPGEGTMSCNWRNGRKGYQVKQGVGRALEEEKEPGQKPEEVIWSP